jgi:hypothetical protein
MSSVILFLCISECHVLAYLFQGLIYCISFQDSHLCELLSCCRAMLHVCENNCADAESSMFKVGLTVFALAQDASLKKEAKGECHVNPLKYTQIPK